MHKLSNETSQLICSAQVVTCTSNAVKELVENSLDAGATCIDVKLEGFGLDKIEVRDNGVGMLATEIKYAGQRHYTSKITTHEDLQSLETYGFRGEALNSLCEMGGVTVITRTKDQHFSTTYTLDSHGCITSSQPSHLPQGTTVIVSNLFKNLPVRRQYFKSMVKKREQIKLTEEYVMGFYLANYSIRLSLFHDKCLVWRAPKSTTLKSALVNVFGSKIMAQFKQNEISNDSIKMCLFMPKIPMLRKNCDRTFVIINKRSVRNKSIDKVLRSFCKKALKEIQQTEKCAGWPAMLLTIKVPLSSIDANVNPNKTQVILTVEDEVLMLLEQLLYQNQSTKENIDKVNNASTVDKELNNTNTIETTNCFDKNNDTTNAMFCPDENISKSNNNNEKSLNCVNNENSDLKTEKSSPCHFDILNDDAPLSSTLKQLPVANCQESAVNKSLDISEIEDIFDQNDSVDEREKFPSPIFTNENDDITKQSEKIKQNLIDYESIKSWSRGDKFGTSALSQSCLQPVRIYTGDKGSDIFSKTSVSRKRNSDETSSLKQSTLDNYSPGQPRLKNPRSDFHGISTETNETSLQRNVGFDFFNNCPKSEKRKDSKSQRSRLKHRKSFTFEKFCSDLSQAKQKNETSDPSDENDIEIPRTMLKFRYSDLKSKVISLISTNTKEITQHNAKVIGRLNDYNSAVIQSDNDLFIPNLFRMQEKIIYDNLMRNHKLTTVELDSNLEITENNIGIDAYNVLHNLPGEALNEVSIDEYICEDRILSNGFRVVRIRLSESTVLRYEVQAICCTVPYYGLSDLKELLETIGVDQNIQLHDCRPLKIQFYLQSESARVCKSMQPHQIIEDFSENLILFKQNLPDAKCFHHKLIFHHILNVSKL